MAQSTDDPFASRRSGPLPPPRARRPLDEAPTEPVALIDAPPPAGRSTRDASGRDATAPAGTQRPGGRATRTSANGNGSRRGTARPRRRSPWIKRALVAAVIVIEIPVAATYVDAVLNAGNEPIFVTSVEWVRHHGGDGFVNQVENWWYTTLGKPKEGGRPDEITAHGTAGTTPTTKSPVLVNQLVRLAPPTTPVPTPAAAPEPGEGVWSPAGRLVDGTPAIYTTFVRPDATHTSYLVGLIWIDTKLVKTVYVPGLQTPGGGAGGWNATLPESVRPNTIAAFNGAFQIQHARGGAYSEGRTFAPLRDGAASVVIKSDGTVSVGAWGRDFTMGPDIASVRQNLELLVDGGKLNPALRDNDNAIFGPTVGGQVHVWRSGLGVTADGALIYAGGPSLNVTSLARTLLNAGAVNAMSLDINSDWVSAYIYGPSDPANPASATKGEKLHPNMSRDGSRYFSPSNPDFFALLANPQYQLVAQTPTTTLAPSTTTTTRR